MCLIFLSINDHPTYKLIVVANRDEFYLRKTQAASFWHDHPDILAGRDLEAGGTWMGVSKRGKVSMITNYRDIANINPKAPSRGFLVSDFLLEDADGEQYLRGVEKRAKEYNGFNLLVGDADALWYLSNYRDGILKVDHGFHGLSNALLDTAWPKVKRGGDIMRQYFKEKLLEPPQLFELMYNNTVAADDQLPDTGLPLERERALSSMFIKSPGYGSRCSTVLLVDYKNNLSFTERVYNVEDFTYREQHFQFRY